MAWPLLIPIRMGHRSSATSLCGSETQEAATCAQSGWRAGVASRRGRPTVLLVGSDVTERARQAWTLRVAGWHVEECSLGEDAAGVADACDADVVVVDLRDAPADAAATLRLLQVSRAPTIACTADATQARQARDAGCDALLARYRDPAELHRTAERFLLTRWAC